MFLSIVIRWIELLAMNVLDYSEIIGMEWALCQGNPMMPCSEVVHPLRLSHMVAPGFNNGS